MKTNIMAADAALAIDTSATTGALVETTRSRLAAFSARCMRALTGGNATQELATLDDRLLRDIGMTDAEIGRTRAAATPLPLIWN